MYMFLKSGRLAYGGMMTALITILLFLAGVFEHCSLFCLAAAAFVTGGVAERTKPADGFTVAVAAGLLGFFLLPNKWYLATYAGFAVYVLVWECLTPLWHAERKKRLWAVKGVLYHILLGLAVFLYSAIFGLQELVRGTLIEKAQSVPFLFVLAVFVLAEGVWLVFDRAYVVFRLQWQNIHKQSGKSGL